MLGGGGTHRDLAGVLVTDLLHLLTAVSCRRRSGSEAEPRSSRFALPVPKLRPPAPRPIAPTPGAVGQALAQA